MQPLDYNVTIVRTTCMSYNIHIIFISSDKCNDCYLRHYLFLLIQGWHARGIWWVRLIAGD